MAEASYEVAGVIRGHHVYNDIWTSVIGEHLQVSTDARNEYNPTSLYCQDIRHAPRELALLVFDFLTQVGIVGGRKK